MAAKSQGAGRVGMEGGIHFPINEERDPVIGDFNEGRLRCREKNLRRHGKKCQKGKAGCLFVLQMGVLLTEYKKKSPTKIRNV